VAPPQSPGKLIGDKSNRQTALKTDADGKEENYTSSRGGFAKTQRRDFANRAKSCLFEESGRRSPFTGASTVCPRFIAKDSLTLRWGLLVVERVILVTVIASLTLATLAAVGPQARCGMRRPALHGPPGMRSGLLLA